MAERSYDHRTIVKTRTFEKLCVNPAFPKRWDPAKLPPWRLPGSEGKERKLSRRRFETRSPRWKKNWASQSGLSIPSSHISAFMLTPAMTESVQPSQSNDERLFDKYGIFGSVV
jgi:hypothetical protein